MAEYIVTGGAGFIGSAFVWELNTEGIDDILVVDNLGKTEKWKNLTPLKFADYMEKDDFLASLNNSKLNFKPKAIIHLGACSSTTELDASYFIHNNFEYSKILAEYCTKNNIKFIYASSAATYGDGSKGYVDDENSLEELRPLNMYGYSKHMFDLWMKRNGLLKKSVGLKFTNVFGPNETHKGDMRSVVSKAYDQIRDTGKVKLFKSYHPDYKDGEQKRDFIYIKDAVCIIKHFLDTGNYGLFNVGSGRAETWNHLVESVFYALNKKPVIEYVDMPENLRGKYQYFTQADMTKVKNSGYGKTAEPLKATIKDYIQNYLTKDVKLGDGE